jgi:tRNA pseudouridine synthase 10
MARGLCDRLKIPLPEGPEFVCEGCANLLTPAGVEAMCEAVVEALRCVEFSSFLLGTRFDGEQLEREDEMRARYGFNYAEALKLNFNRVVGSRLSALLDVPVDFNHPDLTVLLEFQGDQYVVEFEPRALFIGGYYNKYSRGIPQTHWPCRVCRGSGRSPRNEPCDHCDGKGVLYTESVEGFISPTLQQFACGQGSKFHGAGREDIDARCIGSGRPFVVEVLQPRARTLDLATALERINAGAAGAVVVRDLHYTTREALQRIKTQSEFSRKTYAAVCELESPIEEAEFPGKLAQLQKTVIGVPIKQRTPQRVAHRRSDRTRQKTVFRIEGEFVDDTHFRLTVETQGGTYIKELISGDEGRTIPSVAGIFQRGVKCVELDITDVEDHLRPG